MAECKRLKKIYLTLALASLTLLGSMSCSVYSFKSGGEPLVKSIAVTQLENKTLEAGVADRITELVIDQMISDGKIDVVGPANAEAVLQGALTSYRRDADEFDETDIVTSYVVRLVVHLALVKPISNDTVWVATFENEGKYLAESEVEEDGQARAVERLVIDILNKTTRSW